MGGSPYFFLLLQKRNPEPAGLYPKIENFW